MTQSFDPKTDGRYPCSACGSCERGKAGQAPHIVLRPGLYLILPRWLNAFLLNVKGAHATIRVRIMQI
ncbi:MAG: hypothetical protein ACPGRX_02470, partial [Bdellovibrionales bacterium]